MFGGNFTVTFWVSHKGILGNELAGDLRRRGAEPYNILPLLNFFQVEVKTKEYKIRIKTRHWSLDFKIHYEYRRFIRLE